MISKPRAAHAAFAAVIVVLTAACGGTSVSHVDAGGMAGMSESGGSGTTGGSSGHGGSGATGGAEGGSSGAAATGGTSATGGTGATGGSGNTGATGGFGNTGAFGGTGALGGAGGTGGISGSGGDAGSPGGTGGGTACATGNKCGMEGATCSESACCSCSHTCKGGVWSTGICPPCAAPICPSSPPLAGDMCSACGVPAEGCTWDETPVDGPIYTAECIDGRWAVTISDYPACCSKDGDCPGGICVGQCRYKTPDQCWRDDQCGAGQACSGVHACGCAADCSYADEPGVCVPSGTNCCLSDKDCVSPSYCLAGICKAPPSMGCWTQRDCKNGGFCQGANVCPCGTACLVADSPGNCVYPL